MMPSQIFFIRQSLNKGCRLFTPGGAAMEAFKNRLLTLLHQPGGMESEEEAKSYLADILEETCFSPGYADPKGNSSPVCFANAPDLRPGFEDTLLPEQPTPAIDAPSDSRPGKTLAANADLRAAIKETQQSVRHILEYNQAHPPAANALEKQIEELVYRLYGLGPKEIAQLEGA